MGIVARDIGLDLGTSNTQVFVKHKGVVISEPSFVVVDGQRKVKAVGEDARQMMGHITEGVIAIRPLREGVITDFNMTRLMIEYFIHSAIGRSYLFKPKVFLSYPCAVTPIERRALGEAAKAAGARKIYMAEKPLLSALGSGLPVMDPVGCMVVDIGGGTTDVAVISLGGVVIDHSIRVGGVKMDEAIANYIKQEYNILIGDRTSEDVKLNLGAALPLKTERKIKVRGRDLVTNLPQIVDISSSNVYEAIHEPTLAILDAIKWVLERTPPELAADIMKNGIYLTGGGSQLYGMDQLIASELGIPVLLSKTPQETAILGLGDVINNLESLEQDRKVSFLQEP